MKELDNDGSMLLALLVEHLQSVIPGRPETYITYKQVHDRLGLKLEGPTYGESLKHQGLSNLADWTEEKRYPGITGLIIDGSSYQPGDGYFKLFSKSKDDFQWWKDQIRMSKSFDWKQFLPIESIPGVPQAFDIEVPQTERERVSVLRVIRDTALARKVKYIHKYECQICCHTICLPDGSRYAEAHHLKPLGNPHNGPDILENIICVCPNHHAELDYGATRIQLGKLKVTSSHRISQGFIDYHNLTICCKS